MLKYLLVGVVFLLAMTASFYGGLFIGLAKPEPPPGLAPPPPADYWTYPGSKELMRAGGQKDFLAVLVTPDDFDAVARFYQQQISQATGLSDGNFDPQGAGISGAGFASGNSRYASDSRRPDNTPRNVRVFSFEVQSQGYDLTVFVNRAEGEGHTHITLTFDPKEPR
jgi:hypothetical protein